MASHEDPRDRHRDEGGATTDEEPIEDQGGASEEEDDEDAIVVDFDEAKKHIDTQYVAIGKFFSRRTFSAKGLFEAMQKAWGLRQGMEYKRLHDNRFLLEFQSAGDFRFATGGGPWIYQGDAFLITEYDGKSRPSDVKLNSLPVWVRIYDLPLSMMTETMGKLIGARLGEVRKVAVDDQGRAWDDFMRVRAEHPVDKSLTRWLKLKDKESSSVVQRYDVKYERIPRFCFYYGHIGHMERECDLPSDKQTVRFGLNLRASPYKQFEHRSWALPGKVDNNAKRNLWFPGENQSKPAPAGSRNKDGPSGKEDRKKNSPEENAPVKENFANRDEIEAEIPMVQEELKGLNARNPGKSREDGEVRKLAEQWEHMGKTQEDQPTFHAASQQAKEGQIRSETAGETWVSGKDSINQYEQLDEGAGNGREEVDEHVPPLSAIHEDISLINQLREEELGEGHKENIDDGVKPVLGKRSMDKSLLGPGYDGPSFDVLVGGDSKRSKSLSLQTAKSIHLTGIPKEARQEQ